MSAADIAESFKARMLEALKTFADPEEQERFWVVGEPGMAWTYADALADFEDGYLWLEANGMAAGVLTEASLQVLREFYLLLERFNSGVRFKYEDHTIGAAQVERARGLLDALSSRHFPAQPGELVVGSDEELIRSPAWRAVQVAASNALEKMGTSQSTDA